MSSIELVLDEPVNYWAFSYCLISNENDFEFNSVFFVCGIAEFLI